MYDPFQEVMHQLDWGLNVLPFPRERNSKAVPFAILREDPAAA